MLILCLVISSILAFSIFGIHDFVGVAIFGALYGFWSGSCKSLCLLHVVVIAHIMLTPDVSLIPSLLAQLSAHVGEQGYVASLPSFRFSTILLLVHGWASRSQLSVWLYLSGPLSKVCF